MRSRGTARTRGTRSCATAESRSQLGSGGSSPLRWRAPPPAQSRPVTSMHRFPCLGVARTPGGKLGLPKSFAPSSGDVRLSLSPVPPSQIYDLPFFFFGIYALYHSAPPRATLALLLAAPLRHLAAPVTRRRLPTTPRAQLDPRAGNPLRRAHRRGAHADHARDLREQEDLGARRGPALPHAVCRGADGPLRRPFSLRRSSGRCSCPCTCRTWRAGWPPSRPCARVMLSPEPGWMRMNLLSFPAAAALLFAGHPSDRSALVHGRGAVPGGGGGGREEEGVMTWGPRGGVVMTC